MNTRIETGVFGKLPAHGDFVVRCLPQSFVSVWDEWLQHYMAGSKEQLGENWLNIYLTSPIWRFVFSPGVIDNKAWAGVMLPSVDRVGRYYPMSAVACVPDRNNPLEFISLQSDWFTSIEDLCMQALNDELDVDTLTDQLNTLEIQPGSGYETSANKTETDKTMQIDMEFEEQLPVSVLPLLFDRILQDSYASYGVWSTTGSQYVRPCLFITQSLPPLSGMPAMIDGQWQNWGWHQPYSLQEMEISEILHG